MRSSILLLIVIGTNALCWAAEGVARVEAGSLLRDGEPLPVGAVVPAGVAVSCAAAGPAALRLQECTQSRLLLGADSRLTVQRDGRSLVVAISAGTVQLELHDRGPYRQILLRGRAAEAVVTGTLLVGEVLPNDRDLFAVAEGAVVVRLRREVAKALGHEDDEVELHRRQHVLASRSDGIAAVQESGGRYQLDGGAADRATIVDQLRHAQQATAADTSEADWVRDRAAVALGLVDLQVSPAVATATADADRLATDIPVTLRAEAAVTTDDVGITDAMADQRSEMPVADARTTAEHDPKAEATRAIGGGSAGATGAAVVSAAASDAATRGPSAGKESAKTVVLAGRDRRGDESTLAKDPAASREEEGPLPPAVAEDGAVVAGSTQADELRRAVADEAVEALLDSDRLIDELVQTNLLHGPLDDFPAPP